MCGGDDVFVVYKTEVSVPGPPDDLALVSKGETSLSLSWGKPRGFSSEDILDYHVRAEFLWSFDKRVRRRFSSSKNLLMVIAHQKRAVLPKVLQVSGLSTRIFGLLPGSKYNVSVTAASEKGHGVISSQIFWTEVGRKFYSPIGFLNFFQILLLILPSVVVLLLLLLLLLFQLLLQCYCFLFSCRCCCCCSCFCSSCCCCCFSASSFLAVALLLLLHLVLLLLVKKCCYCRYCRSRCLSKLLLSLPAPAVVISVAAAVVVAALTTVTAAAAAVAFFYFMLLLVSKLWLLLLPFQSPSPLRPLSSSSTGTATTARFTSSSPPCPTTPRALSPPTAWWS